MASVALICVNCSLNCLLLTLDAIWDWDVKNGWLQKQISKPYCENMEILCHTSRVKCCGLDIYQRRYAVQLAAAVNPNMFGRVCSSQLESRVWGPGCSSCHSAVLSSNNKFSFPPITELCSCLLCLPSMNFEMNCQLFSKHVLQMWWSSWSVSCWSHLIGGIIYRSCCWLLYNR